MTPPVDVKKKPVDVERELPFGVKQTDDLALPFCACGRVWSQCDGSRAKCRKDKR